MAKRFGRKENKWLSFKLGSPLFCLRVHTMWLSLFGWEMLVRQFAPTTILITNECQQKYWPLYSSKTVILLHLNNHGKMPLDFAWSYAEQSRLNLTNFCPIFLCYSRFIIKLCSCVMERKRQIRKKAKSKECTLE